MKMKEVQSCTWTKIAEVKTRAKTPRGILKAILREVDWPLNEEDIKENLKTGFIELCDDGVILWQD